MSFLLEVIEGDVPVKPDGGWNIGVLAHLGVLLSCDGFSARIDLHNLNELFDFAEDDEDGDIKDSDGNIIEVQPRSDGIVLIRQNDENYPHGVILDHETLAELGIEVREEEVDDPESDYDELSDDDTISNEEYDTLEEGVKRAYLRSGKKIKRGYRVTSGFRKGRVVSSIKSSFKPRIRASTRSKMRIAAKRRRIIRVFRGKRTRKLPKSKLLVRMNKRIK